MFYEKMIGSDTSNSQTYFYLRGWQHRRGIDCTCFVHHTHMMEVVGGKV